MHRLVLLALCAIIKVTYALYIIIFTDRLLEMRKRYGANIFTFTLTNDKLHMGECVGMGTGSMYVP